MGMRKTKEGERGKGGRGKSKGEKKEDKKVPVKNY